MKQFQYKRAILISLLSCIVLLTTPCKKAIYVPAEGDVIQMQVDTTVIAPGASVIITLTGIKASGQPMPDNTLVVLSADSGQFLDPQGDLTTAVRLIGGKARATYQADENFTGEAVIITAQSGSAVVSPEQLVISIRDVEIATLFMTADPLSLPPSGGTAQIEVTAYDSQQDPVAGEKIFLETSAGTLTPESPMVTDDQGKITASLTTTEAATVTATYKEITNSILIDVGINVPPTASFEFSPQNPTNGDTIHFTSTSSDEEDGTDIDHNWVFGDGTGSTEVNPTHVYPTVTEDTEFKVVLTVTDSQGKTASVAQSVTITLVPNELPVADFIFSPENPDIGQAVYFTSLSTDADGTIETYQWNFGDGSYSSAENPIHTYTPDEPTIFNIKLTVTDDQGGTATAVQQITVGNYDNQPPIAAFTFSPTNPRAGEEVRFNAEASTDPDGKDDIDRYEWNFGDHDGWEPADGVEITHTYEVDEEKTFTVTLKVVDKHVAEGVATAEITVRPTPVASFTFSPSDPKKDEPVTFDASSSEGDIETYKWYFGDGDNITKKSPVIMHTYTTTNTFRVTLTVTDINKRTSEISIQLTVTD